jgi:IS5 family transposase
MADVACENALLNSAALRRFVGIDLERERVPDATTLLKFRRLQEASRLSEAMFTKVSEVLQAYGLKVGRGTIMDATIIGAPSSTKNVVGSAIRRSVCSNGCGALTGYATAAWPRTARTRS